MADTKTMIQNLRQSTAPSSITPDTLAGVLDSLMTDIETVTVTAIPTADVEALFPNS